MALTVSARLDQDGVAATRGPDDLVRSVRTTPSAPAAIALEHEGRRQQREIRRSTTGAGSSIRRREPSTAQRSAAARSRLSKRWPRRTRRSARRRRTRLDEPAPAHGLLEGAARAGILHVVKNQRPTGPRRADGVGNVPRRPFVGVVAVY